MIPAVMILLAAAGFGLSASLLQAHLTVLSGGLEEGFFCSGAGVWDCNAVAAHESASFLGLPVALWGLVYYALVLGLAIEALFLRDEDLKATCALGTNLCALGLLFDGYLGFVMMTQIRHVCLSCAGTYLINLLLLLGFWRRERALEAPLSWSRLLPSLPLSRAGTDADYYRNALKAVMATLTLLATAFTFLIALGPVREVEREERQEVGEFLAQMAGPPQVDMSAFEGRPSIGPRNAVVTAAVTGDFQCSFCRSLANHLEALRRRYPDKIRLIFVNFPVSSECNPHVHERVHEDACWLARAGECAAAQGRFWEYHDLAFQRIAFASVRRENVLRRIGEIGIDPVRLRACLETPAPAEAVAEDIALAKRLGLMVTPTVVINGYVKKGSLLPWMLKTVVAFMVRRG
jgi:protein-disulfide isomerase/uncharacterized membrane protein